MWSPRRLVAKIMDNFQSTSPTRMALGKLQPLCVLLALAALSFSAFAETQLDDHLRAIAWPPYQDETVQLMREYLRIDTSNPPGNELAAAEFFHGLFDQAGIPNTIYPYSPGRANICAVIKGDGTLRPLVLLNHMDVVHQYNPQAIVAPALGSGYTECQMFRPLGITCDGFNTLEVTPEVDATQHAANERVPVEQLRRGVRILYELVARAANQ